MSVTTVFEYENDNGPVIKDIVDSMSGSQGTENVYNELYDRGLADVLDFIMITRHGQRILDPWQLQTMGQEETPLLVFTIKAYLKERERYFMQQLSYFDSEYNPIENYAGNEVETTEFDIKLRHHVLEDTEQPYSRTHTRQNPQVITEQYTEAPIVSTTAQTQTTSEHKVAPFDSSTYHAESKDETNPGTITSTEQAYNRKFKTPQNTVTDTESLAANKVEKHEFTDDAHKDKHTRTLEKTGNIGIQTAAQMMQLDEEFWYKNRWMSQTVLDIVNLICYQVEGL